MARTVNREYEVTFTDSPWNLTAVFDMLRYDGATVVDFTKVSERPDARENWTWRLRFRVSGREATVARWNTFRLNPVLRSAY